MNAERVADLIGFDGVLDMLRWAEGKRCVQTNSFGRTIWEATEYEIRDGKTRIVRVLARCTVEDDGQATVVFAGSELDPKDWNLPEERMAHTGIGGWERTFKTVDDAMRARGLQGVRTGNPGDKDSVLIHPMMPVDGWVR